MNIDFEAYTVWGLVRGGIEADQPLHDLLNHETNVTVHDCHISPLTAGAVTERESAQIDVDDLLVVVAPADVVAPIHASWNELMLGVGPYGVSGLLPTLPGYDPGRSLTRPSGHFVLLSNVAVSRIDRPSNSGFGMVYLMEWDLGNGLTGWGEIQDIWPLDLWSLYRRTPR